MPRRHRQALPPYEPEPAAPALCALCGRPLAGVVNKHHLLPISQGGAGTQTVLMHKICHDKIHSILSEAELRRHYQTPEALRAHPELDAFLRWVAKRPPEFYDRTRRAKR